MFDHVLQGIHVIVALESCREHKGKLFAVFKINFKLNQCWLDYFAIMQAKIYSLAKFQTIAEWLKLL